MRALRAAGLAVVTILMATGCGPMPAAQLAPAPLDVPASERLMLALLAAGATPVAAEQRLAANEAVALLAAVDAFARQSRADEAGLLAVAGGRSEMVNGDGSHTVTWRRASAGGEEIWTRVTAEASAHPLKLEHVRRTGDGTGQVSQRRIKVWLPDGGHLETLRQERQTGAVLQRADLTTTVAADGTWTTNGSLKVNGTNWVVAKRQQGQQEMVTLREGRSGIMVQGQAEAGQDLQTLAVSVAGKAAGTVRVP